MSSSQSQQLNLTRLKLYLATAKGRMSANFSAYPCLGLHFGFGDSEIERLQKAVLRHERKDQFDNLTVPVDVLLRTLSFIPNERDPRLAQRTESTSTSTTSANEGAVAVAVDVQKERVMRQKTMLRVAATCSTLLYCITENRALLGYSGSSKRVAPEEDIARAERTFQEFAQKRLEAQLRQQEQQRLRLERDIEEEERRMQRGTEYYDRHCEGLPPRKQMITNVEKVIERGDVVLDRLVDLSLDTLVFKNKAKSLAQDKKSSWSWGSKKDEKKP